MDKPEPINTAKEIFDLGAKQVIQTAHGDVPVYIVPNGMKVETLKSLVEEQRTNPWQLKQHTKTLSAESFIEYFNRFANDASTIFVDIESGEFVGVLDYHEAVVENNAEETTPAWKNHTVTYTCPKTKEWQAWQKFDNEKMDQETFALFIEDNLKEITEPNGAQMLEIAASLKAKTNVDFKSSIRLDNGQTQFTYAERVSSQAGETGQLEIPEKIKLAIKPLQFGAPYVCEARFRYRITPNGLTMWYTLIRPHLIAQDAINDVFEKIKTEITTGHIIQASYKV